MKTLSQAIRKRKGREVRVGAKRVGDRHGCFSRGHRPQSLQGPDTPITRARPIRFLLAAGQLPSNDTNKRFPIWRVLVRVVSQVSVGTREDDPVGTGGPGSSSQSLLAHLQASTNWADYQNPAAKR